MARLKKLIVLVLVGFTLAKLWGWNTHRYDFSEKIDPYESDWLHWNYIDNDDWVYSRTYNIPLSVLGVEGYGDDTFGLRISYNLDNLYFGGLYYDEHVPGPVGIDWQITKQVPELLGTSHDRLFYLRGPWIFNGVEISPEEIMERLGEAHDGIWVHTNLGSFIAYETVGDDYKFLADCKISFNDFTVHPTQCTTRFDVGDLEFGLLFHAELIRELDSIKTGLEELLSDDVARFNDLDRHSRK